MENNPLTEQDFKGDSYATPKWLFELFKGWFDPCPLNFNPLIDGLNIEWGKKTYVNPPYSEPLKWVEKAIIEKKKGKLIVMLLRADSSTKYFQKCQEEGEVLYFGRRIKFNGKTPYFASMLVIFNGIDTSFQIDDGKGDDENEKYHKL
jgi:hypothetical protein